MMPWERAARGRQAAEQILGAFGVDLRKSLNPLDAKDFQKIVRTLSTELRGHVVPVQDHALKQALNKVDANWLEMSGPARGKVLDEAVKYLTVGVGEQVMPSIQSTLSLTAKTLVPSTKSKAKATYDLKIDTEMNATDYRIADYARRSQGHFIRNKFGEREQALSAKARSIVSTGLDHGFGSAEISNRLYRELGDEAQRSKSYWDIVASVFANRARSMTQLSTFAEAGIAAYVWESVLDEVTTVQCRFLHGQKFPVMKALHKFQQVEDSGDPESVKTIQPFLNLGRNDKGEQYLYYNHADGTRRTVANVDESAFGQADKIGKFSNAMDSESLLEAGIHAPPLHGSCRSTIVPEFGDVSTGTREYSIPSAPEAPTNAPANTALIGGQAKSDALDLLAASVDEVGDINFDSENPIFSNTEPQENYHEVHQNDPYMPALTDQDAFAKQATNDTLPIDTLRPTTFSVSQSTIEKLIKNPSLLASQPLPKVFTNFDGQSYLLTGHETVAAQKLLGKTSVDVSHVQYAPKPPKVSPALAAGMKPNGNTIREKLAALTKIESHEIVDEIPGGHQTPSDYMRAAAQNTSAVSDTAKSAVKAFTGSAYTGIRAAEATEDFESANELFKKWGNSYSGMSETEYAKSKRLAKKIDKFFAEATPMQGQVFRGIKNISDDVMHSFLQDDEFVLGASSSTTWKKQVAFDFANATYRTDANRVVLVLRQKSAVAIEHISLYGRESELLMSKKTKFRITSRRSANFGGGENSVLVIEAEEI